MKVKRVSLKTLALCLVVLAVLLVNTCYGANPIITTIYTADPSGHAYAGKMYLYPSHDRDNATWWDMTDWHVFSSANLVDWTDHGVALSLSNIPYAQNYAWAPDCAYKNGTYYFYFPCASGGYTGNTNSIGVATSSSPSGSFTAYATPLVSGYPQGFDPCCFIDTDGSAYLVCGQSTPYIAKLKDNMVELAESLRTISGASSFFEGIWLHKYNNKYYLSYSGGGKIQYAMGDSPYGPYTYKGVVLENQPYAANTTHHSIVQYNSQWYLFWHNKKLATLNNASNADYKRSVCLDYLYYNADGTIKKVIGTDTGVGGGSPGTVTVNDNTTGIGNNQFEYVGSWGFSSSSYAYNGDNHWSNTTNSYYQVRFNGTQIKLYCPKGPLNGKAAVSVDGGTETTVDLYNSSDFNYSVVYTSATLISAQHTLKVRVTGQSSSTGYYVNADRVDITSDPIATATPTPTPGATPTPTPTPISGGIVSGATYKLFARHSGKLVGVSNGSTADGATCIQWPDTGATDQKWVITDLGTGYYKIINVKSGKALDINGVSTADGAQAIQWTYGGGNNQQWQIVDVGSGYYKLIARHSGKALIVSGASTADGANIVQWTYSGSTNQQWQLAKQ